MKNTINKIIEFLLGVLMFVFCAIIAIALFIIMIPYAFWIVFIWEPLTDKKVRYGQ